MDEGDLLPPGFTRADTEASIGQRRHTRLFAARLALSIAAAGSGAFAVASGGAAARGLGTLAALAFLGAFGLELWTLRRRPGEHWYDARATAESIKTVMWRFAVGGAPFPVGDHSAQELLRATLGSMQPDGAVDRDAPSMPDLTWLERAERLHALRSSPIENRRACYLELRLLDQRRWYATKADRSALAARRLQLAMLSGEGLGVVFACSEAFGLWAVGLSGFVSSGIGAGAAWLALRQHESISRTYRLAADQLEATIDRVASLSSIDEPQWSDLVATAESQLVREHVAWHAARSTHQRPINT